MTTKIEHSATQLAAAANIKNIWGGIIYNVKDTRFAGGAKGDGVTDDTAAFQAVADLGGMIYVPPGTYIVDYVTISQNCTWVGVGIKSCVKKKDNSVGSSPSDQRSYLFNLTSANLTVHFDNLLLDGNYVGQTTTYNGLVIANNGTINNFVSGSIVLAGGGLINTQSAVPTSSSERLVLRVTNCKLYRPMLTGIYFDSAIDIGAYSELSVENCEFYQAGPSIIEYHDGVSAYDGIVYPASGYSTYFSGVTAVWIRLTDSAALNISGCSLVETRSPTAGTITTGYDYNMYNLPASAINITSLNTGDITPEWSRATIANNYFKGMGRTYSTGNGIGVIDFYTRGGPMVIDGNIFENSYGAPIRGKSNARETTITANVLDTVNNELGINIGPATYPSQRGNYTITGNVVKNAGSGIQVTGNNIPAENSDPNIPDDVDAVVNNIVIADNVIENIDTPTFANPILESALAAYGWGIQVRYASCVTITGNIIKTLTGASASAAEHGIYIRNCKDGLVISNNVVNSIPQDGIQVADHAGDVAICGNAVTGVGSEGIFISNTGRNEISNNMVKTTGSSGIIAGSSACLSVAVIGNIVTGVAGNSTSSIFGIDSGAMANGEILFVNNTIDGVANAGSGAAYGMRAQFSTLADTNSILVNGNTIQSTEESGLFLQGIYGAVSDNYFKQCNTSAATAQGAILINGTANIGTIQVVGNRVDATTTPFPTTGGASGDTMRNNGKIHEGDNSWQSKQIWRNAAPTAGTWAVGDVVWNSAPAAAGFIGWVCTTAGTPGTWKTFGAISA